MKASDLIGRPVLDSTGRKVGVVSDLRCIQDGPLRGSMAAPRVHQVLVSGRRTGSMLGYDRRDQQGPWLIRWIVRRLHRKLLILPWESVTLTEDAAGGRTLTMTGAAARQT
jgi:sporulation protein YlmC with PRC-barrel domain